MADTSIEGSNYKLILTLNSLTKAKHFKTHVHTYQYLKIFPHTRYIDNIKKFNSIIIDTFQTK